MGGMFPQPDPPIETPIYSTPVGAIFGTPGLTSAKEPAVVMNTKATVMPRANATPIPIPHFVSLPTPTPMQSTTCDSSLSMAMSKFVASEVKARNQIKKSSKRY